MQPSHLKPFVGALAAVAMCVSPTMATAATSTLVQPVNPLVAVSVFGTQASAQTVCANTASAAAAAGAAVAAQGQAGCVLPAVDTPPPTAIEQSVVPSETRYGIGIAPIILGLLGIAALAALIMGGDDDDNGDTEVSPN